jgi:ribose 5-phosphate isomerase B
MRVHLGSDHAGLELKEHLLGGLRDHGHEPVDHGPFVHDPVDDYPVFCLRAAEGVVHAPGSLGVVSGGSGHGEQLAANTVEGVRAALVWSADIAVLAREHNDANVISVGGRMHTVEEMTHFVDVFLRTPFSHDERHVRRIAMVSAYDETGQLPDLPASARGLGPDA